VLRCCKQAISLIDLSMSVTSILRQISLVFLLPCMNAR